jgi:hypothetical protein
VQSSVKHGGTYAMHNHYEICSDSTDSTCGASHQDANNYAFEHFDSTNGFSNGLTHFFVRGYFYQHANAGEVVQSSITTQIGRKLMFFKTPSSCSPVLRATGCWRGTLSTVEGVTRHGFSVGFANDVSSSSTWSLTSIDAGNGLCTGTPWYQPALSGATCVTPGYQITLDAWYYVEIEIDNNSVGLSDGTIKVWAQKVGVDPSPILIISITNASINGPYTNGVRRVEVGVQTDRMGYNAIDEERYWDDLVISDTYVGP